MMSTETNPAVDVGARPSGPTKWWPWLLLVGGVCGFAASLLHPQGDLTLSGDALVASELADPLWNPAHVLLLASVALLVPGLLGLARSGVLSGPARTAAWVAFGASILWLVESVPHLLASADHHALLAGQPTPFLTGHVVGSMIVYPLATFSIAALALLGRRRLAHPVVNVLGAVGAVSFGLAPIGYQALGSELGVLFLGSIPFTAWIALVGATALVRKRAHQPQPAA